MPCPLKNTVSPEDSFPFRDIELSPEKMTQILEEVGNRTVQYLSTLSSQPAWKNEHGGEMAGLLREGVPEEPSSKSHEENLVS